MNYYLPKSLEIRGQEFEIRSDYRAVLDAIAALNDPELSTAEQAEACLRIIYPERKSLPDQAEALKKAMWFIGCGEGRDDSAPKRPKIMDWEQDFSLIVPPVNRVLGYDCRGCEYLHWWSFIAAYYEIGDCAFAVVTGIRNKQKRGKKLEDWEKEYLRNNPQVVELKTRYTEDEKALIDDILGGDEHEQF